MHVWSAKQFHILSSRSPHQGARILFYLLTPHGKVWQGNEAISIFQVIKVNVREDKMKQLSRHRHPGKGRVITSRRAFQVSVWHGQWSCLLGCPQPVLQCLAWIPATLCFLLSSTLRLAGDCSSAWARYLHGSLRLSPRFLTLAWHSL